MPNSIVQPQYHAKPTNKQPLHKTLRSYALHMTEVTLVSDQLDAQLFYIIIRLLQSSTCFEQRRAHHQEVKF